MTRFLWIAIFLACTPRCALSDDARDLSHDPLCGVKCLYSGLVALDLQPGEYPSFLEKCGDVDARGFSLGRIEEIAKECGATTLAVNTTLDNLQLRQERFVCIAHVDGTHYVNLGDVDGNQVWVVDPPRDGMIATEVFAKRWDGNALLLARTPLAPEEELRRPVRWGWIMASGAIMIGIALGSFLRNRRAS